MTFTKSLAFLPLVLAPQLVWASNDVFREDVIAACHILMKPDVTSEESQTAQLRITGLAAQQASAYAILFLWNLNAQPDNRRNFIINFLAMAESPLALGHLGKLLYQENLVQPDFIQRIRDAGQDDEESALILRRLQISLNTANENHD